MDIGDPHDVGGCFLENTPIAMSMLVGPEPFVDIAFSPFCRILFVESIVQSTWIGIGPDRAGFDPTLQVGVVGQDALDEIGSGSSATKQEDRRYQIGFSINHRLLF